KDYQREDNYYAKWPYPTSRAAGAGYSRYSSTASDLPYHSSSYDYYNSRTGGYGHNYHYSTDSIPYSRQLGSYSRDSPYYYSNSYPALPSYSYYSRDYSSGTRRDDSYLLGYSG